jgi:GNAT superfamily N-acetyltransferase
MQLRARPLRGRVPEIQRRFFWPWHVVPARRGKGIARALVHAAEGFLQARGAAGYQVTLTQHSQKHGLKHFYSRLGFAQEGREILYRKF